LDTFILMPNHLHGLLTITGNGSPPSHQVTQPSSKDSSTAHGTSSGSIGAILQNFKSVSTRRVNQKRDLSGTPLWQRNYFERIVRDERELLAIRRYIVENPAHWDTDHNHPDYPTQPR
jgi:REP element-mobilizing transposase RayT